MKRQPYVSAVVAQAVFKGYGPTAPLTPEHKTRTGKSVTKEQPRQHEHQLQQQGQKHQQEHHQQQSP